MSHRKTRILNVTSIRPPELDAEGNLLDWFDSKRHNLPQEEVEYLLEAARLLRESSVPVAFPTETVYGLGADATRSDAVRGIFTAKQRPSDNPLIVHVGSLDQIRELLRPRQPDGAEKRPDFNGTKDVIPEIYKNIIRKYWPGPLTLLFPLPSPSPICPEVNSNLSTVGIRMPSSPLARLLILLSDRPLAAPSANRSGRPSPTTAEHVLTDLEGRIDVILDGGSCDVGVESTVVDGLTGDGVPVILRPGRIGVDDLARFGGVIWAKTRIGYGKIEKSAGSNGMSNGMSNGSSDTEENGESASSLNGIDSFIPRAPGMKYRHYAPRAKVHLFQSTLSTSSLVLARRKLSDLISHPSASHTRIITRCDPSSNEPSAENTPLVLGIICTSSWSVSSLLDGLETNHSFTSPRRNTPDTPVPSAESISTSTVLFSPPSEPTLLLTLNHLPSPLSSSLPTSPTKISIYTATIGPRVGDVARNLFAALRELDRVECSEILVEGVHVQVQVRGEDVREGHGEENGDAGLAEAVMNRLRKAAEG